MAPKGNPHEATLATDPGAHWVALGGETPRSGPPLKQHSLPEPPTLLAPWSTCPLSTREVPGTCWGAANQPLEVWVSEPGSTICDLLRLKMSERL